MCCGFSVDSMQCATPSVAPHATGPTGEFESCPLGRPDTGLGLVRPSGLELWGARWGGPVGLELMGHEEWCEGEGAGAVAAPALPLDRLVV